MAEQQRTVIHLTARRYTEEWGKRNDVLRQALLYPKGLTYQAFLTVLPPEQQAIGRRLLREGYLIEDETDGIRLSPILKLELPPPTWDEPTKVFYLHLGNLLYQAVWDYRKAEYWVRKAKNDPEQLFMLVHTNSRDKSLSLFEQRLSNEALHLFQSDESLYVLPKEHRELLINGIIGIEQRKNREALRSQLSLFLPTLENVLQQLVIPEDYLLVTYDLLWDALKYSESERELSAGMRWILLRVSREERFDKVLRNSSLGRLYHPQAEDQNVGALIDLSLRKEVPHEKE